MPASRASSFHAYSYPRSILASRHDHLREYLSRRETITVGARHANPCVSRVLRGDSATVIDPRPLNEQVATRQRSQKPNPMATAIEDAELPHLLIEMRHPVESIPDWEQAAVSEA